MIDDNNKRPLRLSSVLHLVLVLVLLPLAGVALLDVILLLLGWN